MSDDEKANAIRDLIKHENDLVNHRISWMSAIQGLLFSALAFSWEKAQELIPLLCSSGKAIAIITIYNCWLATTAIQVLLRCHERNEDPPVIGLNLIGSIIDFIQSIPQLISKALIKRIALRLISYFYTSNIFKDLLTALRYLLPYITSPAVLITIVFYCTWSKVADTSHEVYKNKVINVYIESSSSPTKCVGLLNSLCLDY